MSVRILLPFLFLFLIQVPLMAQFSDSVFLPRVWLRADRGVTSSQWTDQSGFVNHGIPTTGQMPQNTGVINYNPANYFNGEVLSVNHNVEGLSEITLLGVVFPEDTLERGIWGTVNSQIRNIQLTTNHAIGPDSAKDEYSKAEKISRLQSVLQNWDNVNTSPATSSFVIGKAITNYTDKTFKGLIGEFMLFHSALPFTELIKAESYLCIKYGLTLKRGNYVSSQTKQLWSKETNAEFHHRIVGIGRDDAFSLFQKQSHSMDDPEQLMTISVEALSETNNANTGAISNQDFILLGDNDKLLTSGYEDNPDSVIALIERKWMVQVSGLTANKLETELRINVSKFPVSEEGYWLGIDRSGSADFHVDNLEYVFPSEVTKEGVAIFKDVLWDIDGSGRDCFAIVMARPLLAIIPSVVQPTCASKNSGSIDIEFVNGKAPFTYTLTKPSTSFRRDRQLNAQRITEEDLNTGEYYLNITDANNLKLERKFYLTMADSIVINLGPDQNLKQVNRIQLDASKDVAPLEDISYHWSNNFGFSQSEPKITITESGVYTVSLTRLSDGCVCSDQIRVSGASQQKLALYPNILRSGEDFIIGVSLEESSAIQINVFNSNGNNVQKIESQGQSEYQFKSRVTEAGVYLVVIRTPKGMDTRKLVIY